MNIENLRALRDVGNRILDEGLPLGFDTYECDTYACLAGWYKRLTPYECEPKTAFSESLERHFEITNDQREDLFGTDHYSHWLLREHGPTLYVMGGNEPGQRANEVLKSRLMYLDTLITEAESTPNVIPFPQVKHVERREIAYA